MKTIGIAFAFLLVLLASANASQYEQTKEEFLRELANYLDSRSDDDSNNYNGYDDGSTGDDDDDDDDFEALKRFFFKKKTTTPKPTTTTTTKSGGLNDLIKELMKTSKSTSLPLPITTTTKKPSGGGGLDSLINGLMKTSTARTTKGTPLPVVTPTSPSRGDPCYKNPCQNKGVCVADRTKSSGFRCQCPTLFTGDLCESLDNCFSSPCKNGGTCHNMRVKYYCSCQKGYHGDNCEKSDSQKAKVCLNNPCLNGGTCHQFSFGQYCQCPSTHYGNNCEKAFSKPYSGGSSYNNNNNNNNNNYNNNGKGTDGCARNPCKNGAWCESLLSGFDYYCHCTGTFTGKNCDVDAYGGYKPGKYGYMMDIQGRSEEMENSNVEELYERDLYDIQAIRSLEETFPNESEK